MRPWLAQLGETRNWKASFNTHDEHGNVVRIKKWLAPLEAVRSPDQLHALLNLNVKPTVSLLVYMQAAKAKREQRVSCAKSLASFNRCCYMHCHGLTRLHGKAGSIPES